MLSDSEKGVRGGDLFLLPGTTVVHMRPSNFLCTIPCVGGAGQGREVQGGQWAVVLIRVCKKESHSAKALMPTCLIGCVKRSHDFALDSRKGGCLVSYTMACAIYLRKNGRPDGNRGNIHEKAILS